MRSPELVELCRPECRGLADRPDNPKPRCGVRVNVERWRVENAVGARAERSTIPSLGRAQSLFESARAARHPFEDDPRVTAFGTGPAAAIQLLCPIARVARKAVQGELWRHRHKRKIVNRCWLVPQHSRPRCPRRRVGSVRESSKCRKPLTPDAHPSSDAPTGSARRNSGHARANVSDQHSAAIRVRVALF